MRALVGAGLAACEHVLFVFISEVAWKKEYLRKTVPFGFVATMQLLSNYFDLLSYCGRRSPAPLLSPVFTQAWACMWRNKSINTDDDHAAVTDSDSDSDLLAL